MDYSDSAIGLEQYWQILRRRWLPASIILGLTVTTAVGVAWLQKPTYQAEAKLQLKKEGTTPSVTGLGRELGNLEALNDQSNPLDTEAEIMRSLPVLQQTIARLSLKDAKGISLAPEQLLKQLAIAKVPSADIVKVAVTSPEPQQAAAVVNTLIAAYLDHKKQINRSEAAAARQFLEQQLPKAEATVRNTETRLRQFREQHSIVSLQEEKTSQIGAIASLQQQLNETRSQLASIDTQANVLRNHMRMNSQQAAMATALSQSPAIQEVQTRLQQLESELTLARTRFTDSNPAVRDLEQRVDSLRRSLRQRSRRLTGSGELNGNLVGGFQQRLTEELVRLESNRLGLARQIATLSSAQELYRQRARQLPFLEQQQRQLERKLETSQSTYSLLLQKLQEIRVAENQNTDNVRVLAMAPVPATPVAPRKSLFMVTGLLLGSLLGLATALVLEALDKSIKTVEATKAAFGFDLLGVIPLLDQPHKVLPQFDIKPNEAIHESYWMVTSNLLNAKADPRVIVVTSAVPSEGKSTVAANLSAAIAQSGRKVLLIDADLQQPTQHHIWQLPNRLGLSNVLQDKIELRTAIHEITPALDTLFSGATTSAPSALLSSQEMAALIEDLASWYEFIIIDTSPLNMAAGAAALGQLADGIVLVARPGIVDATSAAITRELLEQSGQNVLGMIINGIAADQQPYAIYSYAYNRRDRQPPPQRLALPWRLSRDSAMPIAPIVSLPEQISLDQPIDTKVLESIPSTKLQEIVEELQASLEQLLNFVEQEEEELQSEHQTIKTIRQKINTTDEYERFGLELELAYEQERQELLSESLVGQRSNLQRRQELLNQCLQVMHKRKVKRMSLKVKRSAS